MEVGFAPSLRETTIGIVGLGLMGGSLAMGLKGKCARLIGFDSHPATLELALSKNIIDQAGVLSPSPIGRSRSTPKGRARGEGGVRADILILATPVPSILSLIHQLPDLIHHPCILMDIGSTKRDILRAMSALPGNFDPLGGHPICGREKPGLENATADLYQNAPFIITPLERTTDRAKSAAEQIISAVGAHSFEMNADDHDRILASTSHLPFIIAASLAHSTPGAYAPFIGPGFRSTSRLAGSPSSMMTGILKSNRDHVLNAIQAFRRSLDEIESALHNEEYPQFEVILNQSRNAYHRVVE
jgi:prephenate dehydrogenase